MQKILEVIENGGTIIGIQRIIDRLLSGYWVQEKHDMAYNNDRPRARGSNTGYAPILQGKSSEFIGSQAFRNVIRNLFEIQERDGELDARGIDSREISSLDNGNTSHSLKDNEAKTITKVEQYTESDYRKFGWARANNILNEGQNADYRSKFADAKVGRAKLYKSKIGEYIIPVSDIYDSSVEGINNVLVFAKGTIANPIITSVIEIYEYDETNLDIVRRQIYESERRGIQQKTGELFRRYFASDFKFQPRQQGDVSNGVRHSSDNRHGERSGGETSAVKGET